MESAGKRYGHRPMSCTGNGVKTKVRFVLFMKLPTDRERDEKQRKVRMDSLPEQFYFR